MSELQVYNYQPVDENDFPIGAKQVFKYKDHDDLVAQITQANIHLLRKLRQVTKENRLSNLSQTPPEMPTMTDDDVRSSLFALRAERTAENFIRLTPEYYKCQENTDSIFAWIEKNNLSPIDTKSYQLAYEDLSADSLLILGPQIPKPAVSITPVVPVEAVPEPVLPQIERVIETIPGYNPEPIKSPAPEPRAVPGVGGLNRGIADGGGDYRPSTTASEISYQLINQKYNEKNELITVGSKTLYGTQALAAMPTEEYKRRLIKEPGFAAKVDKVEKEAKETQLAARRAALGRL